MSSAEGLCRMKSIAEDAGNIREGVMCMIKDSLLPITLLLDWNIDHLLSVNLRWKWRLSGNGESESNVLTGILIYFGSISLKNPNACV